MGLALHVGHVRPLEWLMVLLACLYANLVEYWAHRVPLHIPMPPLRGIYKAHAIQHHRFFTHEHMACDSVRDLHVILFHPISHLVFIVALGLPAAGLCWALFSLGAALLFLATAVSYFLVYEWLHMIYHLPSAHPLALMPGIARLRLHHLRHHDMRLMSRWNFNISFPVFDHVFGTAYRPEAHAAGPLPQSTGALVD